MNQISNSDPTGNEKTIRAVSYVLVFLMMLCVIMTINILVHNIMPAWTSNAIAGIVLLIVVDRLLTFQSFKSLVPLTWEWIKNCGAQWIVIALFTRLFLSYANGPDNFMADISRIARGYAADFFNPEFVVTILLVILVWYLAGHFLELLDEIWLDQTLGPQNETNAAQTDLQTAHQRLINLTFGLGILLVFLAALTRFNLHTIFSTSIQTTFANLNRFSGGEVGVLLYFIFGLVLLSQSRLMSLQARWSRLHIQVSSTNLAKRWGGYTLLLLLFLMVIVSILPSGDSLGFFSLIETLFDFLFTVLFIIAQLVIALVSLLFILPFLLLGKSLPAAPILPEPLHLPNVPATPPTPAANAAFWEVIKSTLLWGVLAALIVFSIIRFVMQRGGLLAVLRQATVTNWLGLVWQWLRGNVNKTGDDLSRAITTGWKNIFSRRARRRVFPRRSLIRLRSLDPRRQIYFFYLAMVRRADEHGLTRKPSQSPSEYAISLENAMPSVNEDVHSITEAFVKARYSRDKVDTKDANLVKSAWKRIRRALQAWGGTRVQNFLIAVLVFSLVLSACAPASTQSPNTAPTPTPTATQAPVPGGKYIIGYYPSWAAERNAFVKDIPANKLTHINYAFSNVSENGECILGDPAADVERVYSAAESVNGKDDSESSFHGNFNQLLELKQKYPNLKVLISIGGWSWSGNFSIAAQGEFSRQRFATSCIDLYLKQYNGVFDGFDIDWEFPVSGGLTPGKSEDKTNFTLLLGEFRRQLKELESTDNRHYLLTIAAPIGPGIIRNIQPDLISLLVDWINLMGYDFHGTWETTTNFNAPLFQTSNDPAGAGLNVDAAVQSYLSMNVPPEKLVLGVPFYGKGWAGVPEIDHGLYQSAADGAAPGTWEAGSYDYKDLQQNYLSTYQRYWNEEAYVPWLYDSANQIFISYDDTQSLKAKAGYARDLGLAGVMIWELSQGDETLLDALHDGLASGGPPRPTPAPTVILPRPFEKDIHAVSGIVLDGKLDDWSATPDFVLNDQSQVVYSLTPQSWSGPQDLSTEAWAGWAPDGLYFAFHVVDDVHVQLSADASLWHGDHIELQFDTMLEKDFSDSTMNDDDYQIGLSLGDFDQVPLVAYAWFNGANAAGTIDMIQLADAVTDDGYILETFISKDALSGIVLDDGATFGMNISPSDTDNETEGQKAMLSTSSIRTYADPRTFGKITLVK